MQIHLYCKISVLHRLALQSCLKSILKNTASDLQEPKECFSLRIQLQSCNQRMPQLQQWNSLHPKIWKTKLVRAITNIWNLFYSWIVQTNDFSLPQDIIYRQSSTSSNFYKNLKSNWKRSTLHTITEFYCIRKIPWKSKCLSSL